MTDVSDVMVLGAGATGLSAAAQLGPQTLVLEAAADPGGLCRSRRVGGYRFDETAHVLHFRDALVREMVGSLLGDNLAFYQRQSRVYTHGRITRYPFQSHLHGLPPEVIEDCVYGKRRAEARAADAPPASTLAEWLAAHLGEGVSRHFMTPYNTKFWTLPPEELAPAAWVDAFIPVPTLAQMERGALTEDPTEYGYNVTFAYPKRGGVAALMEALMRRVPHLQLGARITHIDAQQRRVRCADGRELRYGTAISTIPLPALRQILAPLPEAVDAAFGRLRWISLYVLHLGIRDDLSPPWDWIYVADPEVPFFRVGCPSRYAIDSAPPGCRTLSVECSSSAWHPLQTAELPAKICSHLKVMGLLSDSSVVEVTQPVWVPYGYPIGDHAYEDATRTIRDFLTAHGIIPAGRFGRWAYISLEDSLQDGLRAAADAMRQLCVMDHV